MKKTTTRTTLALAALALAGLASAGCFSRATMTKSHGRAYRQAFQRQAVTPVSAVSTKAPKGLDALESTIVVETYRKGLAPGGGGSQDQMIVLSPGAGSPGHSHGAPAPSK